jgi:hypothetical protein
LGVSGDHPRPHAIHDDVHANVSAAREAYAKGVTQTSLARTYGVSVSALNGPVQRKTWRHVS